MIRKARLVEALLLAALAAPRVAAQAQARIQVPVQSQIIDFSLLELLNAIDASEMAGVFGFIPEDRASMAMADYLIHNHKALKKFIKKAERDVKEVEAVNDWDKQVALYLVGISSGALPAGVKPIPKGWMSRINQLALAPALPLQMIVQKRANRG